MGCGGGLVVSVLAFFSDDPSSNPAGYLNLCLIRCLIAQARSKLNPVTIAATSDSASKVLCGFLLSPTQTISGTSMSISTLRKIFLNCRLKLKCKKTQEIKTIKKADYIKSKLWTVCGQGLSVEPGTSSTNTKSRPVKLSTLEKIAWQPFLQVLIYSIKCRQLKKFFTVLLLTLNTRLASL